MNNDTLTELKNLIDIAKHPVVVVILAEGCDKYKGQFLTNLEDAINKQVLPIHLHIICYNEEDMVFPRPFTQTVYYFAPKNYTPLFFRQGSRAMSVATDIVTALKMIEGKSYTEAAFTDDVKTQYETTETMIATEDMSKFPSVFQQARNFAKEMWQVGKNVSQGLPILVDADMAFTRFTMCQACEFLDKNTFRCQKCGCFMKQKTQLSTSSCPIGKWTAIKHEK